ncbi:hypothetical protein [Actinoplanes sp. NBRC 101535]|uniref:hypothetical protein n=1 Tax=Actinoplanes sp. NBRC 101535 TaxID=3032196 RepID=UPI00249FA19C|nr:hypothetical protein [Actinoplanes sp. NBRC 101535]GLX99760.1 hypothetical protein Acsp01_01400 [Actinoplanes sp. NBRC 101535]
MTDRRSRLSRRALIMLGLGSVAAATAAHSATRYAAGGDDIGESTPLPDAAPATADKLKVKTVAHWTGVFLQSWDYQEKHSIPLSRSRDSRDHYDLAYSLDACVAMFRATDQRRFLDRALDYVENVVAAAVPSKDGYRGWPSVRSGEGGNEVPLYESYFWRYATTLLTAMKENPAILADPNYRARYDTLLTFAEVQIFEKWYSRGQDDNIYRERTHMAAHWALIALNLSQLTADERRRGRYTTVLTTIGDRIRKQLRRNPVDGHAYFWSDVWGSAKRPGQDAGHGNGVITYVVEARDHGRGWTDADVAAFAATLTTVVWPSGTTYHAYVDGTGKDNGWYSDGFVKLGRYDPAVQLRLENHQVVNDQFAANMALNARILRA